MIREELAAPGATERKRRRPGGARRADRGRSTSTSSASRAGDHARAGARARGVRAARSRAATGGEKRYAETRRRHRGRLRAARALRRRRRGTCARSGRRPTARPALLEQLVAPALRVAQRRAPRSGPRSDLQTLAELAQELVAAALLARRCGTSASDDERDRPAAEDPRRPGLPDARASSSRTSRRCSPTPTALHADGRAARRRGSSRSEPDLVLGAEARGFILGAALACRLGCGFVPARQPGQAAAGDGQRDATRSSTARTRSRCTPTRSPTARASSIHDDVLATGGTVEGDLRPRRAARRRGRRRVRSSSSSTFLGGRERLDGLRRPLADHVLTGANRSSVVRVLDV